MRRAAQLCTKVSSLRACGNRCLPAASAAFATSSRLATVQPNPRLDLDPSLQTLLQDVDIALQSHPKKERKSVHELEIISLQNVEAVTQHEQYGLETDENLPRKSPAALFGSQRTGSVVLPLELQDQIQCLISEANKTQLHSDAKRLFQKDGADEDEWEPHYDTKYRTRIQGVKHAKRDGTAFASVALPAHYSVIYAVLDHVKQRLGPTWSVERVIDWGAGVGSGLWASLYSFQGAAVGNLANELRIADSTLKCYVGIEKRNGLTEIGRRLIRGVQSEATLVSWRKAWHSEDNITPSSGGDVVALSAFLLTTLPDVLARKKLVQEIWESGANTIILIDHNSKEGFEAIAAAREYLLACGRRDLATGETTAVSGSHVVAPCPHDGACPLYSPGSTKLVCGYSQRIQRPEFVRRTKHSSVGHEDAGYSYVVIQRGSRPHPNITGLGRVGAVGQRELDRATSKSPMRELQVHDEQTLDIGSTLLDPEKGGLSSTARPDEGYDDEEVHEALRVEAYRWPRLVFPPLKKSGHIILDGCTAEGKIMRMTIPKSQGKQPFYDARKSSWGDIFPHPPKNKPQERQHVLKPGSNNVPGSDIGKRGSEPSRQGASYEQIAKAQREERKRLQRRERRIREAEWGDD